MNYKTPLFVIAGVFLFLFLVSDILLPFIVGILAAYFLDPVADKMEEWGLSRVLATTIITITFFGIIITVCALLLPILYEQFISLSGRIPEYISAFQVKYGNVLVKLSDIVDLETVESAKYADYSAYALKVTGKIIGNLWHSGIAFINLLSLLFITPVVSFYLIKDWDILIGKLDNLLPIMHKKVIREQILLIDNTLSGYIRGQSNVCLILGVFYAIGLSVIGLDFGLFVGFATGILAFIPYVGLLVGMTTGVIIAFFQFGDSAHIMEVFSVFIVGQIIEGNFITPKLVGDKVGLHAVWIIFGLLSGGVLFGFTGILLAVPVTAVLGVLIRFIISQYFASELYKGDTQKNKCTD